MPMSLTARPAEIGEIAICEVRSDGERFMYISDKARNYLAKAKATPKPSIKKGSG